MTDNEEIPKRGDMNAYRSPGNASLWYTWFPFSGLIALVSSLGTAYLTGYFDSHKQSEMQQHEIEAKTIENSFTGFQYLINVTSENFQDEEGRNNERKARICLAANFGVITIPDYVIGESKDNIREYSIKYREWLNEKFGCNQNNIPEELNITANTSENPVDCASMAMANRSTIAFPSNIIDTELPRFRALRLAIDEYNSIVHEECSKSRIEDYWDSAGSVTLTRTAMEHKWPWSSAFISYLIKNSGENYKIEFHPNHHAIWHAFRKSELKLTFSPSEKDPAVGDIMFVVLQGTDKPIEVARTTEYIKWTGQSGIIIDIDKDYIYVISGGVDRMVGLRTYRRDDLKILGFLRL